MGEDVTLEDRERSDSLHEGLAKSDKKTLRLFTGRERLCREILREVAHSIVDFADFV